MFIPHLYLAPRRGWRRRNFAKMFDNRKTTPCSKKLSPLMFDITYCLTRFWQMWTDFQNSFTRRFVKKFSMYTSQKFPSNLQYNILQVRWKSLWYVHREFSYESHGERILKICQSYYQTSRGLFFLEHGKMIGLPCACHCMVMNMLSRFHRIPERNGRTNGQTDRFAISIPRVSILTRPIQN